MDQNILTSGAFTRSFVDEDNLTDRAFRAYRRTDGPSADIPSRFSGVEHLPNGRAYVVLRGGSSMDRICAVYSIRVNGGLRRITRLPKALVL